LFMLDKQLVDKTIRSFLNILDRRSAFPYERHH